MRKILGRNTLRKVRVKIRGDKDQPFEMHDAKTGMRPVSMHWDLKEELTKMWQKPISSLPVHGDLPRLCDRTTLEIKRTDFRDLPSEEEKKRGETSEWKSGGSVYGDRQELVGKRSSVYGGVTEGEDEIEEIYFDASTTWYVSVCMNVPNEAEKMRLASVWPPAEINGLVSLVLNSVRGTAMLYLYDQDAECMIVEKQDAAILVPTKDSMRYFAIPEEEGSVGFAFYSREDSAAFQKCLNDWKQEREEMVQKVGGSLPSRPSTAGKDDGINGRSARMHLFETLSSLVCRIAETLEPRETALQVKNSFDFYKKNGTAETMDMGMIMQAILKNGVGPRTESILKAIHQGVILTTAFEIKHKVTKSILTKDVRTKDGWRVHVHLAPNGAVVTHTRREMSIGARGPEPENEFVFEWRLSMFFNAALTELEAVKLRLTDLQFGPQTTAENKQKLNQTFFNGQLHVY